ncbi:MAG: hypothetical protein ACLQMF_07275 [Rectinemataceae bacterium]
MMTTKLIAETELLLEKVEALANEVAPIDYAFARQLRDLARRRRAALERSLLGVHDTQEPEGGAVGREKMKKPRPMG